MMGWMIPATPSDLPSVTSSAKPRRTQRLKKVKIKIKNPPTNPDNQQKKSHGFNKDKTKRHRRQRREAEEEKEGSYSRYSRCRAFLVVLIGGLLGKFRVRRVVAVRARAKQRPRSREKGRKT